jgi:cholest-4-en-3-one 26-monooxygenase
MRNPLDPNLYRSGDPAAHGYPWDLYRQLRTEQPCVRVELGGPDFVDSTWILSRHADVVTVDRDSQLFTSRAGHTHRRVELTSEETEGMPSMITMDGPDHSRLRKLVSKTFTPRVIKAFEVEYRAIAEKLVARAVELGRFDLIDDVAVDLPAYAICKLLGVPAADRRRVVDLTNTLVVRDEEFVGDGRTVEDAMQKLGDYALELAELRRREPGDDVVSALVPKIGTPELSRNEFVGMVFLLAAAGNETTRTNIGHSVHALLRNPDQLEFLRTATEGQWAVAVEELTRFATPVVAFRRIATEDVDFHGTTIPRGDSVTMLFASANFDETVFDEPERLDLCRSPNPQVSFGAGGRHFCLGAHLARLETKLVLQELLDRARNMTIDGPPVYARDSTIRGLLHLPMTVTPNRCSRDA